MSLSDDVENRLVELEGRRDALVQLAKDMTLADGGNIHLLDLFMYGVLNRAWALITGFVTEVRAGNFPCAAALVRLHLDNVLRLYAAYLAPQPGDFVLEVMRGKPIRKLVDRHGQKMTDAYLVGELEKEHSWVESVYEATCAHVHLSEKHIFQAVRPNGEVGGFSVSVGSAEDRMTDANRLEGINCMVAITDLLGTYVAAWVETKGQPPAVTAST